MILTVRDRRESDSSYGQPSFFVKHRNGRHRFLRWQVDNLSVLTQMHTDEHRWDTDFRDDF